MRNYDSNIRISIDYPQDGTKLGDLDWEMLSLDPETGMQNKIKFRGEVKFRSDKEKTKLSDIQSEMCSACLDFFNKCSKSLPEDYYCIFFCYIPLESWVRAKKYSTKNKQNLKTYLDNYNHKFILIDDFEKMKKTVLDIPSLVARKQESPYNGVG